MGQGQGKESSTTSTPTTLTSSKTKKKTVKGRPVSSQVSTDTDGTSAFTLPWDLRDGGIGNGPSFSGPLPPPPPVLPPPPPDSPESGEEVTSKRIHVHQFCFFFILNLIVSYFDVLSLVRLKKQKKS